MDKIYAVNGRDALIKTAHQVMESGDLVKPRGMTTREIRHLTVQIDNPYDTLCVGINANQSLRVAAAEAIQLIGGFSNPAFAVAKAPELKRFLNENGEFDGAYGPRIALVLPEIVNRLTMDPDTRQAVIPIWNSDDARRDSSKDFPCTLSLGFYVRHDSLELDVTMRSNDVNWGFKNDMFQFTQLQISVAKVLGMRAGTYRHTAFSMHLYERDWEWAEGLNRNRAAVLGKNLESYPAGITGFDVRQMFQHARMIAMGQVQPKFLGDSERWYWDTLRS